LTAWNLFSSRGTIFGMSDKDLIDSGEWVPRLVSQRTAARRSCRAIHFWRHDARAESVEARSGRRTGA